MTEKNITLEDLCNYSGKTPEQLVNMLIAAGKVNRGHYRTFMKYEEDEMLAMNHRIKFNTAIVNLHNINLAIEAIQMPGFPKTTEQVKQLLEEVEMLREENFSLKTENVMYGEKIQELNELLKSKPQSWYKFW